MSFDELINNKFTDSILKNVLNGCDDGELFWRIQLTKVFI